MFNRAEQVPMDWTERPVRLLPESGDRDIPGSFFAGAKRTPVLILDEYALRLIRADPEASGFVDGLLDSEGRLDRGIALSEQIRALGPLGEKPRYARLRFDPRGIAAPTTCWLSRVAREDGSKAIVIGLVHGAPRRRRAGLHQPRTVGDDDAAAPAPETVIAPAPRSERIVWRSDAHGRLSSVTGGPPHVVATLRGRVWSSFPDGGVIVLSALREQRTFRALSVIVRDDESGEPIALSVSGAPLARAGGGDGDWAGFAIVRPSAVVEPGPDHERSLPEEVAAPVDGPEPATADATERAGEAAANGATASGGAEKPPLGEAMPAQDLLSHERDAFREIARTLGALLQDAEPAAPRPVPDAEGCAGAAGTTIAAVLESLPAGVLVARERDVLFTNRRLSDLLELDGEPCVSEGSPLSLLLAQQDEERPTAVPGAPSGLLVERSMIDWDGAPATLVLVRPAPAVFRWFGAASSESGGSFAPMARAPAMLGASGQGRGAIDPRGRVLVIKPAPVRTACRPAERPLGAASVAVGPHGAPEPKSELHRRSGGAVVALRQRVERLLSLEDAITLDHGSRIAAAPVPEDHRTGEEPARRFAFFATIGQAVRHSLVAIRDAAEVLLDQVPGSEAGPNREQIRTMRAATVEASNLLDGLLAWTLVASGRADPRRRNARLNAIVAECIADLQVQAAGGRVLLRTSLAEDAAALKVDEPSLSRAASNAIAHAIEQSRAGGQVIVSTVTTEGGEALLRVRSTGFEMSAEAIAQALDPVGSLDAGAETHRGFLALTLAKALAEVNGGRLSIGSRPGDGTLVEIGVPSAATRSA